MKKICFQMLICIFLVSCGGKGQEEEPYISNDYINVSPNVELLGDGQTVDLKISSNCSWTITKDAQWLTVSPMSGNGSLDVSISAGKNTSSETRSAVLVVKGGKAIERKVTVTQLKESSVEPEPDVVNENTMEDLYFHLRGAIGRRYMEAQELSSDEFTAICYNTSFYDEGVYARPSLHDYNPDDSTISWISNLIDGIDKANNIIGNTTNEDYIAMARAMRALFTFMLMDSWGDAPILAPSASDQIVAEVRQPRASVARWIESELKAIINSLPLESTGKYYGKPNRYMALALLAKLYINWPVYTCVSPESFEAAYATNEKINDCVSVCDEIIKSRRFELGPDAYRFKFSPDNTERVENGTIKDFIYAMPYHTTESPGMQYGRAFTNREYNLYYGERLSNSSGGYMVVTPEAAKNFKLEGDERNLCIIGLGDGTVYIYDKSTLLPTDQIYKDNKGNNLVFTKDIQLKTKDNTINVGDNYTTGCRSVKWFVWNGDYSNGRNQSNDVPIFRYADILLMKAEAITRGVSITNGQTAMSIFNEIRSYVKAPLIDHQPTLEEIYEERGREFFAENWRRNDMIRFGHFEDEFFPHYKDFPSANFDKTRRVFPIPQELLSKYPNWRQNNGY